MNSKIRANIPQFSNSCAAVRKSKLASIGIHNDILDYDIIRSYERGMYIAQWDASEAFIGKLRRITGRASTYEWAERLRRRRG